MIRLVNLYLGLAIAALVIAASSFTVVDAFVTPYPQASISITTPITSLYAEQDDAAEGETVEAFLKEKYPLFESLLLSRIPGIYSTLSAGEGFTIFCPSNTVMEGIDAQRKIQISDPRNEEVTEKLASYHVIPNSKVPWERLKREDWTVPKIDGVAALSIGGVLTLGGELRVGRSKSGGFMGFGAKEDGGVVIGNNEAKIVVSREFSFLFLVHLVLMYINLHSLLLLHTEEYHFWR